MTTTMSSKRPPRKPPPPDPNRSGPPEPKGKGKAKAAMPEEEEPTDLSAIELSQEEEIPINESKAARKRRLQDKAEYEFVCSCGKATTNKMTNQTPVELKRFIKYAEDIKDFDAEAATISIRVLYSAGQVPTRNTLEWRFISTRRVLYTKEYKVKYGKQRRRRPYMAGAVRSLHTPPHVAGGACT